MRRTFFTALIILCTAVLPAAGLAQQAPREADTAKKCAICHYRWVYSFFVEHRSTPIAKLVEAKDVVGEPEMCLSCHDGSVMDSRNIICNTPSHRAGVVPSKQVSVPATYTLDEKGAMLCSTCHTPHAVAPKGKEMVSTFMREPNIDSSMCVTCHTGALGGLEKGNHPLGSELYKAPDEILRAGGRFGSEKRNTLICETCHMAHGGATDQRLVLPVTDTRSQSILCEVCHTKRPIKPGEAEYNRYAHPIDIRPDHRVQLPRQWSSGDTVVTGPDGELVCRTCHRPHGAADKGFLLAEQTGENGLCVNCHKEQKPVIGSTHDLRLSAPQDLPADNATTQLGPCGSCHSVHMGKANFMWTAVQGRDCAQTYCTGCHSQGGSASKKIPQSQSHMAGGTGQRAGGKLPLYSETCEPGAGGKILCMSCHDVHNPAPVSKAARPRTGSYLRLADQGTAAVCISCHPDQGLVKKTPHDMGIAAAGYRNTKGQTIAQSGVCGTCHVAHGAALQPSMWGAPVGMNIPKAWTKAEKPEQNKMVSLCTGCHSTGGIGQKHQPRFGLHPGDFYAQATKNIGKIQNLHINLYTSTGKASSTGGIVCETCHNAHQWDPMKKETGTGLKEGTIATSFLRPDLPQRFCAICHGAEALFRYLYFHNRPARGQKGEPFPFGELQ